MLEVIILAAGQGSRMQSRLPKVLHQLSGRPLVHYTLDAARAAGADRIHVVIGCGADAVAAAVQAPDVQCHLQAQQKGTGHAVQQAIGACHPDSTLLVLFGDVPLVSDTTLRAVVAAAAAVVPVWANAGSATKSTPSAARATTNKTPNNALSNPSIFTFCIGEKSRFFR